MVYSIEHCGQAKRTRCTSIPSPGRAAFNDPPVTSTAAIYCAHRPPLHNGWPRQEQACRPMPHEHAHHRGMIGDLLGWTEHACSCASQSNAMNSPQTQPDVRVVKHMYKEVQSGMCPSIPSLCHTSFPTLCYVQSCLTIHPPWIVYHSSSCP